MEVLNPIYMAPNMTVLTKFWIFILHCLMKRDGVNRMFPFAKRDINRGSRYEPKKLTEGGLNKVCRQSVCLSSTQK